MARKKSMPIHSGPGTGVHHKDRFYTYDELPKKDQKHNDWAADREGERFVKVMYGKRAKYIPMENFMSFAKSPSGLAIDGFATDSYFSGVAIKLFHGRGDDFDYEVWPEHW